MVETQTAQVLMLYDGLCGFCNGSVQWLLRHDTQDKFRFSPQQSRLAEEVLSRHGIDRVAMLGANSVYLIENLDSAQERLLMRSDVTVHSLLALGGFWKVVGKCLQIVPRFLRDAGYNVIARNRFRLAGRHEVCPLPTAAQRAKFLGI